MNAAMNTAKFIEPPKLEEETLRCPFCGIDFVPSASCHDACPLSANCSLVKCTHCDYEFPDPQKSKAASWLMKLFGSDKKSKKHNDDKEV